MKEKLFKEAFDSFSEAWGMLPEPKQEWEASLWLVVSMGDAAFNAGFMTTTIEMMDSAISYFGGLGNPFVHLRLGQALFERGQLDRAADNLMRVYMASGETGFMLENKKYIDFLKTRAVI